MHRFGLLVVLCVPSGVHAQPAATAKEVFRRAVLHQGRVKRSDIADIRVNVINGMLQEEGEHRIMRTYWYREADQAFRIRTTSRTKKSLRSERSRLGQSRTRYFERSGKEVFELKQGNRTDRDSIKQIKQDLVRFESVLGLMLLNQLDTPETQITLLKSRPVPLKDQPLEARAIFGDRSKGYYVLRVDRPNEPRLDLFVHEVDHSVRKAIIYTQDPRPVPKWIYYFASFNRRNTLGILVPGIFLVYTEEPLDEKTKRKAWKIRGELRVQLNGGLKDDVFTLKAE
jgi:hypothetical protein